MSVNNTTSSDFEDAFSSASADIEADPSSANQFDHPERVMPTEPTFDDELEVDNDVDDDTEDDPQSVEDNGSDVFDWTNHKDSLVTVKVNGTEIEVPLGEALNGYLRQEDYTRKTQAVAQERQYSDWAKTFRSALDENPNEVIRSLADAYKIDFNSYADVNDPYTSDDPEIHALLQRDRAREQQFVEMRAQLNRVEQDRVMSEVKVEIATIQSRYPDFQAETVLPIAVERGLTVEDAYLYMKGLEATRESGNKVLAQNKAAEKAKLEADKRAAQKKISRPNGVTSGGRNIQDSDKSFNSFADMFADALSSKR